MMLQYQVVFLLTRGKVICRNTVSISHPKSTFDIWSAFMLSMMRFFWDSSILSSWMLCSSSFLSISWRVTFWEPFRCSSDEETSSVVGTVVSKLMSSDSRSKELETLAAVGLRCCFFGGILYRFESWFWLLGTSLAKQLNTGNQR